MILQWQKSFELRDGRPTGRWQWVCDADDGEYYFPEFWLDADAIAVPPALEEICDRSRHDA